MFLEKSSYHISKTSVQPDSNKINQKNLNDINNVENEKSFWSWFKGLVNPLQNLPIISGIYSSFNSEDPNSDRDLVQNSLGGFLYGGPFGAIAGFGNWMFNKLFNKTINSWSYYSRIHKCNTSCFNFFYVKYYKYLFYFYTIRKDFINAIKLCS